MTGRSHAPGRESGGGKRGWPLHGWAGVGLVAVFWFLNWTLDGPRTHWGFFPLWLGYSLTVDALVVLRTGSSMLTRSPRGWALLFLVSIPGWWLFEALNLWTQNWSYQGRELFGDLEYFVLASISFSTVMPAVFGSAELVSTFGWVRRLPRARPLRMTPNLLRTWFTAGWLMLALLLIWPRYFFPLLWLSVWFILEPVNRWRGNRSLLDPLEKGDWRPLIALATGALICGFFWEMWNFWSYPRWIYHVPFVDFLHVFEMPLLGYGGYLPFALELYAMHALLTGGGARMGEPDLGGRGIAPR